MGYTEICTVKNKLSQTIHPFNNKKLRIKLHAKLVGNTNI